jgi:aspartate kinase
MKFGGTSVSTKNARAAAYKKITTAIDNGDRVAVVISAMGRAGEPYATDTLLSLVGETINPRDKDLLLSCGELISAVVMSDMLNDEGYAAHAVTGYQAGVVTDGVHGDAKCAYVDSDYLSKLIDEGVTPIITGFQGVSEHGEITTLGRGGSDTSAVIIGAALKADLVEIYTDVDGIMSADPRIVENAQFIDVINTQELFQMAVLGAKVIHPKAVEISMDHNLKMCVRNTFTQKKGTTIINEPLVHDPKNINDVVSSITLLNDRAQFIISRVGESDEHKLLTKLANEGISLDLINIFPDSIVFTINSTSIRECSLVIEEMNYEYEMRDNLSKVTAIGSKMHGVPGVMAKIVSALLQSGIEILQSADSYMNISCLVNSKDGEKAVKALHREFVEAAIEYEK